MRAVDRPKEVPAALLREEATDGGGVEEDEGERRALATTPRHRARRFLGVRTRASNRRDRLKTPNEGELEPPRRSTPQRSVAKANKRSYNPSTSSADELSSPRKSAGRNLRLQPPPVLSKQSLDAGDSDENSERARWRSSRAQTRSHFRRFGANAARAALANQRARDCRRPRFEVSGNDRRDHDRRRVVCCKTCVSTEFCFFIF